MPVPQQASRELHQWDGRPARRRSRAYSVVLEPLVERPSGLLLKTGASSRFWVAGKDRAVVDKTNLNFQGGRIA